MKTFVVGSHGKTQSLPGVPLPKSTPKKVANLDLDRLPKSIYYLGLEW